MASMESALNQALGDAEWLTVVCNNPKAISANRLLIEVEWTDMAKFSERGTLETVFVETKMRTEIFQHERGGC